MSETWRLDGHKLHLHPQRVAEHLEGRSVAPIYTEISLTNRCNLRCRFCALEYRQKEIRDLELPRLLELIDEFALAGVKSICFAGEGEPLLYPGLAEAVARCAERGINSAVATNGTLLTPGLARLLIRHLTWIKISLDAIRPATYSEVHCCPADNLERVLRGIEELVAARRELGAPATIGAQAILLPENAGELVEMAARLRELGVDYFVIKPFNHNLHSGNTKYSNLDYRSYLALAEPLQAEAAAGFRVQFRLNAVGKVIDQDRPYTECHGIHFYALVHSDGSVYTCAPHSGDQRFCYGNIYRESFRDLWDGVKRQKICRRLAAGLEGCPIGCRLDEINRYLWELRHPSRHANFV